MSQFLTIETKQNYLLEAAMERNVRQLEVIFPVGGDLQKVDISTVYAYVENFGQIVSCEASSNGLDIRMIEVVGLTDNWLNCCHDIDGQRVFMRLEMHFLDLPMFCLKEICKWLLETSIDDLCSAEGVCMIFKDAATLALEEKYSKNGIRIVSKTQMQADVRLLQCFRRSITRIEIDAEDREHFTYILSSLKKMIPNVLKYLIFSNKQPSIWGSTSSECENHFSNISKADLEDLLSVFSHLEGFSVNTVKLMFPRLPPNLRIFKMNGLYLWRNSNFLEISDTINANLKKIIIANADDFYISTKFLQSCQQIKQISIAGWGWNWARVPRVDTNHEINTIIDLIQYVPQLEVLSLYGTSSWSNPTILNIQTLKKTLKNLKILNLSLTNPSIELMNAISELNVIVECLSFHHFREKYDFIPSIRNFNQLKFLRIKPYGPTSVKKLFDLVSHLPELSVLVLKHHATSLDNIKKIIGACSKLSDFHPGYVREWDLKLNTKPYLEIVSAARGRPNKLQLRIWLAEYWTTNVDPKVYRDNVKYVNVLLKSFKFKSYPPWGFTV